MMNEEKYHLSNKTTQSKLGLLSNGVSTVDVDSLYKDLVVKSESYLDGDGAVPQLIGGLLEIPKLKQLVEQYDKQLIKAVNPHLENNIAIEAKVDAGISSDRNGVEIRNILSRKSAKEIQVIAESSLTSTVVQQALASPVSAVLGLRPEQIAGARSKALKAHPGGWEKANDMLALGMEEGSIVKDRVAAVETKLKNRLSIERKKNKPYVDAVMKRAGVTL